MENKEELNKTKPVNPYPVILLDIANPLDIAAHLGGSAQRKEEGTYEITTASQKKLPYSTRTAGTNEQNKGKGIQTEHLKAISDHYKATNNKSLVFVFAANSSNANHPPSQMGGLTGGKGQAEVFCGWGAKAATEKSAEPYLLVAGIPTMNLDDTKSAVTNDEIEHYIANLYFFLGQGKAVCLPVINGRFAFGGGEKKDLSQEQNNLLQAELTKLTKFGENLTKEKHDFTEFAKSNPKYFNAYEEGKKKENANKEWRGGYNSALQSSKTITADSKFVPSIDSAALLNTIKTTTNNNQWTCEQNGSLYKFINQANKTQQIHFTKTETSFKASTNDPACFEAMAKGVMTSLAKAGNHKVRIDAADATLKATLWLASVKAGLEVVGYDSQTAFTANPEIKKSFDALPQEIRKKVTDFELQESAKSKASELEKKVEKTEGKPAATDSKKAESAAEKKEEKVESKNLGK